MSACGILLCGGSASRMGFDKLNTPLCGKTAIERSMDALLAGGCISATSRMVLSRVVLLLDAQSLHTLSKS